MSQWRASGLCTYLYPLLIFLPTLRYGLLVRKGESYGKREVVEGEGGSSWWKGVAATILAILVFIVLICVLLLLLYYFYYPMGKVVVT